MRKVVVSMNVTLDGFMSGPHCELNWHFQYWNEEMAQCLSEQLSKADTILLGRVTYRAMAGYWSRKPVDLSLPREDILFANMLNSYAKIVFSKTPIIPEWNNSRIVTGDMIHEIVQLKKRHGKDMIIYGSGKVVAALTREGLVDEYRLWLHPVVLGRGKPLFNILPHLLHMNLYYTHVFTNGVVLLCYTYQNDCSKHIDCNF